MNQLKGCFKPTCLGCLGLLIVGFVVVGISALVAWRGLDEQRVQERELTPMVAGPSRVAALEGTGREGGDRERVVEGAVTERLSGRGRLILELGQGGFEIHPAAPGDDLTVEARYDEKMHSLEDYYEVRPDSTWLYHLRFRRSLPALQAMFRAIMGGSVDTYVRIYLPPDVPIALELIVKEGGCEMDLGGLWITEADLNFSRGGFSVGVSEPLREPMRRLTVTGRMGGFDANRLGNASPRTLDVDCRMGGADIDLRGLWLQDCDARLSIHMGGMSVRVPDDVEVEVEGVEVKGIEAIGGRLRRTDAEVPLPVLRMNVSQSMGECEVVRR
jgi:hypothetical protein